MKNIFVGLFIIISISLVVSCEECIKCKVVGQNKDTISLIDSFMIDYPEKCGTRSEMDAFRADVEYEASTRSCKIYIIEKLSDSTQLFKQTLCGGKRDHDRLQYTIDSMVTAFELDNIEVSSYIDTTISNPGTWECK